MVLLNVVDFEPLAQQVEHLTFNQVVTGSIPVRLIVGLKPHFLPPSSSLAKDTALSRRRHEFKSRRGYFNEKRQASIYLGLAFLLL